MPAKRRKRKGQQQPINREASSARTWLWTGVISFSAIIIVLWGWAFRVQLSSFNWQKTPENKLVMDNTQNWDDLFNQEKQYQLQDAKTQIEGVIGQIIASAGSTQNISATSTTGTIPQSTTTNNKSTK